MEVQITLPALIRDLVGPSVNGDGAATAPSALRLAVRDMDELCAVFRSRYPAAAARLWDEQGRMRRNVVVVRNDELLSHGRCDSAAFSSGDRIEFIMQFAGG
jgi:sulfur carrier protein ThiS